MVIVEKLGVFWSQSESNNFLRVFSLFRLLIKFLLLIEEKLHVG